MTLSEIKLVLISSCLVMYHTLAYLTYVPPTDQCSDLSAIGEAVFCCDGSCLDGGSIFETTGLCAHWDDACNDPLIAPICSNDQTISGVIGLAFDSGGDCYSTCNWQNFNYSWSCCDCPVGAVPVSSDCAGSSSPYAGNCLGCTDSTEQIQFNETSGSYECVTMPPQTTPPQTTPQTTPPSTPPSTTTKSTTTTSTTTTSTTTTSTTTTSTTTTSTTTTSTTTTSSTVIPSTDTSSSEIASSTTSASTSSTPTPTYIFDNSKCGADSCARAVTGARAGKLPNISSRAADCSSFMKITVMPVASTLIITKTTIVTTTTPLPPLKGAQGAGKFSTISPSRIPTYAADCAGTAHYSSACSCWGITTTTTTLLGRTKTLTTTVTIKTT